jgi:DNA-binding GntR family transcriptional regulator
MPVKQPLSDDSDAVVRDRNTALAQLGAPTARRKALPRQVRDSIAALVAEDMRPGDPLPSEMAVAERLMVSRSTVREAMKLLEQEGLVETRRGTGRFATALSGLRPERPMTKFESITKMMTELGYEVSTKVVGVAQRAATPSEQLAFDLKPRSQVVETRRLREHRGRPCVYSVNVLDPRTLETPVEDIDWSGSVVVILEGMGHEIVASSAHISVVSEPLEEDALVEFGPLPGPWLMVNEQCVTRLGRCVLISRDYHLGTMFSFSVVRRREEDPGQSGQA